MPAKTQYKAKPKAAGGRARSAPARGARRTNTKMTLYRGAGLGGGAPGYTQVHESPIGSTYGTTITCLSTSVTVPALPDGFWGGQFTANLSAFSRAAAMQYLWQEYRIKRFDILLQPVASQWVQPANGFTAPAPTDAPPSQPYITALRWVNAPQTPSNVTEAFMTDMGATPTMFNKTCVIGMAPVVNSAVMNGGTASVGTGLMIRQSPWLACINNASATDVTPHWGPIIRFNQAPYRSTDAIGGKYSPAFYQIRLVVEFRKPAYFVAPVPPPPSPEPAKAENPLL